jgi:hypothetical protein
VSPVATVAKSRRYHVAPGQTQTLTMSEHDIIALLLRLKREDSLRGRDINITAYAWNRVIGDGLMQVNLNDLSRGNYIITPAGEKYLHDNATADDEGPIIDF